MNHTSIPSSPQRYTILAVTLRRGCLEVKIAYSWIQAKFPYALPVAGVNVYRKTRLLLPLCPLGFTLQPNEAHFYTILAVTLRRGCLEVKIAYSLIQTMFPYALPVAGVNVNRQTRFLFPLCPLGFTLQPSEALFYTILAVTLRRGCLEENIAY
jgi:hypothetical protein